MWFRTRTEERRGTRRAAATGGVLVTWKADGQLRQSLGQCADLSTEGARIVKLQGPIPLATEVHVSFRAIHLEADGVVCRSEDTGTIGVKFTSLTLFRSPAGRRPVPVYARIGKILVAASLLVLIWISGRSYFASGSAWPITVHLHPASGTAVTSPSISLGSTKAAVRPAQGYPSVVTENSWIYGKSAVYAWGDRVLGWKGMLGAPLETQIETAKTERRGKDYFAIGATASEVADVEGFPTAVRGNVWAYGPSEVYFRDGRVVGWKNSPRRSLKVHGAPISP